MSLNCFLELCDYRLLEQVGHIIDLSAESGLQIVHQFAEHRFQGFQQHGEQCDGGYAEYILPHQVHVILHGGRAVLVGLHLPVYRIQTVDERDSHESRHYRIEGFHGDVPPGYFHKHCGYARPIFLLLMPYSYSVTSPKFRLMVRVCDMICLMVPSEASWRRTS